MDAKPKTPTVHQLRHLWMLGWVLLAQGVSFRIERKL
jgi:hypothetical protein